MSGRILVTGCAGFIGAAVCGGLIKAGHRVVGLDNLDPYYSLALKSERLVPLVRQKKRFHFIHGDIADPGAVANAVDDWAPEVIVHLAAQAGVRHSIDNPAAYLHSNVTGQLEVLETIRRAKRKPRLIYASSSSVYGGAGSFHRGPTDEGASIQEPASLYAATKGAGELMATAYSRLFDFDATALRFFTVYGPQGRPDMAYWRFAESILKGRPIQVYGDGKMTRDLTHIEDVVAAVLLLVDTVPPLTGHRAFNVCSGAPMTLLEMIGALEAACGFEAVREVLPMQPGDVRDTWGDNSRLRGIGWTPRWNFRDGADGFVNWLVDWKAER